MRSLLLTVMSIGCLICFLAAAVSARETHVVSTHDHNDGPVPVASSAFSNEANDTVYWRSHFPADPDCYEPIPLPVVQMPFRESTPQRLVVTYDLQTGIETTQEISMELGREASQTRGNRGDVGYFDDAAFEEGDETRNFNDLELVDDPEAYPWRVNAKLYLRFGSSYYVGSGVLIDPYHVLTAGHCVYDYSDGYGWADEIVVVPAYENGDRPFGDASAAQLHSWTGWTDSGSYSHDMGVIDLDRPIGSITGWHGYGYNNSGSFFTGNTFHNPGYPAASPYNGQYMYYWYGDFDLAFTYYLTFFKEAYGGQSGSGAYNIDGDNRYVYAVLSNGSGFLTNDTRITEAKHGHITGFIDEDVPSAFDLLALDVNIEPTSIEAGSQLQSMDYLVHNYSSASWNGSVSVTAYLSSNDNISTSDIPIQTHSFSYSFDPKSSVRVTVTTPPSIPVSVASGSYYVGVILNITDHNSANNESDGQEASPLSVDGGADLQVHDEAVDPSTVEAGTVADISCVVQNEGGDLAGSSILRYYLTDNTTYEAGDTYLDYDNVGSLAGGATSPEAEYITIPVETPGGTWFVLFRSDADAHVDELDEGNNVGYRQIAVTGEAIPPDAITDLRANRSASDVVLTWGLPWDNVGVIGYYVYEHATVHDIGSQLVYLSGPAMLTYTVSGVCGDPDTNHFYDVRARDAAGNIAAPSNLAGEFDFDCAGYP